MKEPIIRSQTKPTYSEFPARSILLYGKPKVGKTETASKFPAPLILNVVAEDGTSEIAGDVVDIATPADLLEMVKWLKAKPRNYRTVVLDGLSTFVLDKVASRPEKDVRRATKEANKELVPSLHTFLTLPYIRVMTAHARFEEEEIEIEREEGEAGNERKVILKLTKVNVYPDLPPRVRLFIEGRVHAFGYCYVGTDGKSKVWWTPYDSDAAPRPRSIAAGNRLGLPTATELNYDAIYKAVVKAPNGEQK